MSAHKFGLLAIDLNQQHQLSRGVHTVGHGYEASTEAFTVIDQFWRDELGNAQCNALSRAALWIRVQTPTSRPREINDENKRLKYLVRSYWFSLLLHCVPVVRHAWLLTGTDYGSGQLDLAEFQKASEVYPDWTGSCGDVTLDTSHLSRVAETAGLFRSAIDTQSWKGRLGRGFHAFYRGLCTPLVDESHVDIVRSLDAILHPKRPGQFQAHGSAVFWDLDQPTGDASHLLQEIYVFRNKMEHVEPLSVAFPGLTRPNAEQRGREFATAARALASDTYLTIIHDNALVRRFSRDDVNTFWQKVVAGAHPPPFRVQLQPNRWK